MIESIARLGEFTIGERQEETVWFYSDEPHQFPEHKKASKFDSGFVLIATGPTRFIAFDGRTFEHNTRERRSSCFFCKKRKKIDVPEDELEQVVLLNMPYGYQPYEDVFKKWKDDNCYDSRSSLDSVCPECLKEIRSIYGEFNSKADIISAII